jgi:hypothetical protein
VLKDVQKRALGKVAVLITSLEDIDLINEYPNSTYIALDKSIQQLNPNLNLKCILDYFDPHTEFSDPNIAYIIANKWYRSENNTDISNNAFSMGLILEARLSGVIASIVRYYVAFNKICGNFDNFLVPKNIPKMLKDIAICFEPKVGFIDTGNCIYEPFNFPLKRTDIPCVKVHRLSAFARIMQTLLFKKTKNKVLCFSDWSYSNQKNHNFLYMNSKKIFDGFYLSNSYVKDSDCFNDTYERAEVYHKIKVILNDISIKFDETLCNVILDAILYEYFIVTEKAIESYCIYSELIKKYSPKSIIIPGASYAWYSMIMQIAGIHNVPVIVVLDGYLTYIKKFEFPYDRFNSKILVKNFAVMGDAGEELMSNNRFNTLNKVKIKPPLLDHYQEKNCDCIKKYGALILFPYPDISNLLTRWDCRHESVINIIECLYKVGINNIAIKIKEGNNGDDIGTLESILKINHYSEVEVLTGPLKGCIDMARVVIGPLGSSVVESVYNDIPYYIYEPRYNGLSNEELVGSIAGRDFCSRNISELKNNLLNNNFFLMNRKKMLNGIFMSDIDFESLRN